jgi:hypothetical protein
MFGIADVHENDEKPIRYVEGENLPPAVGAAW